MATLDTDDLQAIKNMIDDSEARLKTEITGSESRVKKEIKKYIHEGVNATVEGVDNLMQDKNYDSRIENLEKIHPQGTHQATS